MVPLVKKGANLLNIRFAGDMLLVQTDYGMFDYLIIASVSHGFQQHPTKIQRQ